MGPKNRGGRISCGYNHIFFIKHPKTRKMCNKIIERRVGKTIAFKELFDNFSRSM
jgi:hypothetical protein